MPDDYRTTAFANGFGNRIGWGSHPVLLLIDVCKAYWTPGSPLDTSSNPASVASLEAMKNLLRAARGSQVPVLWTTCRYSSDMSDAGLFYAKAKQLDVWREGDKRGLNDWMEELVPENETVIEKR